MSKKVLISLHDVTPVHWERIRKAEQNLNRWGVKKLSYLYIPDYHYHRSRPDYDAGSETDFNAWLQEKQEPCFQWLLHGYYHLDSAQLDSKEATGSISNRFKRKYLTANEGEFLELTPEAIQTRIKGGIEMYKRQFRRAPEMFVAPAWLYNRHLYPVLKEHGIGMTEDHSGLYYLSNNDNKEKIKFQSAPVITWATRTPLRKLTSQIGCPQLNRIYTNKPLLRIAMHPYDFDHPGTLKSIEKVIKSTLENRLPQLYREQEQRPVTH